MAAAGEGGISRFHLQPGGDIVWNVGTGYFGCRTPEGTFCPERFATNASRPQVKMIEIKLSQGAKPAHGGMLPGSKVTLEIAEARGIQVCTRKASALPNQDALTIRVPAFYPAHHQEQMTHSPACCCPASMPALSCSFHHGSG